MSTDLLGDLAVNTMHGSTILNLETSIYNAYMNINPQRITVYLFFDTWFIRCLYILEIKLVKK